jgi:hypothetical protein
MKTYGQIFTYAEEEFWMQKRSQPLVELAKSASEYAAQAVISEFIGKISANEIAKVIYENEAKHDKAPSIDELTDVEKFVYTMAADKIVAMIKRAS